MIGLPPLVTQYTCKILLFKLAPQNKARSGDGYRKKHNILNLYLIGNIIIHTLIIMKQLHNLCLEICNDKLAVLSSGIAAHIFFERRTFLITYKAVTVMECLMPCL